MNDVETTWPNDQTLNRNRPESLTNPITMMMTALLKRIKKISDKIAMIRRGMHYSMRRMAY